MPKKVDYTLTEEQLTEEETAIRSHPDLRVRSRAQIIRLLHKGYGRQEVADLLSISKGKVHYWFVRWQENGLSSLSDLPKSGRPRGTNEEYIQKLETAVSQNPRELGFAFSVWTLPKLQKYMQEQTGITIHENTLRSRLKELGYAYLRPKHDLSALQDKEAKERAVDTLDMLKKKQRTEKSTYSLWTKPQ